MTMPFLSQKQIAPCCFARQDLDLMFFLLLGPYCMGSQTSPPTWAKVLSHSLPVSNLANVWSLILHILQFTSSHLIIPWPWSLIITRQKITFRSATVLPPPRCVGTRLWSISNLKRLTKKKPPIPLKNFDLAPGGLPRGGHSCGR